MPISPREGELTFDIANEIRRIYADAELNTITAITKALKKNKNSPVWAELKLRDLNRVKQSIRVDVIAELQKSNEKVFSAVEEAYKKGQHSAEVDLRKIMPNDEIVTGFSATNQRAVTALATETVNKLNSTHLRILRTVDDVYRQAVTEGVSGVVTGTQTRLQAAQRVMNTFANKGVTGFIDNSGRAWNLSTYAEMATRSASGRAALTGHIDRAAENGKDLVIVSDHAEECNLCRPWEGEILSISGNSDKYPAYTEALLDGLFHPNCEHTVGVYIEGLTQKPKNTADPEGNKLNNQQRYNERMIRKYKRRKAAALTPEEEQKAQRKISEWQKKQREFVKENNRRRKYSREQIDKAR